MTTTTMTMNTTAPAKVSLGFINRARMNWIGYKAYKKVSQELHKMTPRDLDDIGISYGMIHDIAAEAARTEMLKVRRQFT